MANKGTDYGERYLSGSNIAALYGDLVKLATVNKWVESGLVEVDSEGRRNEQQVIAVLVKNKLDEIERLKSERTPSEDLREEIDRARLRKTLLEGDIIELQRDKEKGRLIDLEEAIAERKDTDARIRTKLLSFPSRFALELSGISDPVEIQKILDDGIREALAELHSEVYGDEDAETD